MKEKGTVRLFKGILHQKGIRFSRTQERSDAFERLQEHVNVKSKKSPTTVKPNCESGFGFWTLKVTSAWGSKTFGFECLLLASFC